MEKADTDGEKEKKRKEKGKKKRKVNMYKCMYSSCETLTKIHISTTEYVNRKFKDGMKRYYKFTKTI